MQLGTTLEDPARIFGAVPGVKGWSMHDGSYLIAVDDPATAAPAIARTVVASGLDLVRLAETSHSLEDVYLQFVHDDVEARS